MHGVSIPLKGEPSLTAERVVELLPKYRSPADAEEDVPKLAAFNKPKVLKKIYKKRFNAYLAALAAPHVERANRLREVVEMSVEDAHSRTREAWDEERRKAEVYRLKKADKKKQKA